MKIYMATLHPQEYYDTYLLAKELYPEIKMAGILLSYYYVQSLPLEHHLACFEEEQPEVFLDSGAFSMMTQGVSIALEKYVTYIKENKKYIQCYANLDIIKHAEKTWEYQKQLEAYGLTPLPVFHVGEDWSYLERYLDTYDYIALGVAGTRYHVYMPWLVKCFSFIQKKGTKVHGFGITAWEPLRAFPWHSVDSTRWYKGGRFGRYIIFDEKNKGFREIDTGKKDINYRYRKELRGYRINPIQLITKTSETSKIANALSLIVFDKAISWLEGR